MASLARLLRPVSGQKLSRKTVENTVSYDLQTNFSARFNRGSRNFAALLLNTWTEKPAVYREYFITNELCTYYSARGNKKWYVSQIHVITAEITFLTDYEFVILVKVTPLGLQYYSNRDNISQFGFCENIIRKSLAILFVSLERFRLHLRFLQVLISHADEG